MVSKPSCEKRWKDVPIFKKRRMEPTFCLLSLSLFLGGEDQMEQKIAKNFLRSFKIWGNWVFFAWLHRHYLDPRNARLGTTTSTITTTTSTTITATRELENKLGDLEGGKYRTSNSIILCDLYEFISSTKNTLATVCGR